MEEQYQQLLVTHNQLKEKAKVKITQLQSQINDQTQKLEENAAEIKKLREQVETQNGTDLNHLKDTLAQRNLKTLTAKVSEYKKELDEAKAEILNQKNIHDQELAQLRETIGNSTNANDSHQEELTKLKEDYEKVKAEFTLVQSQSNQKDSEVDRLKRELKSKEIETNSLEREFEELQTRSSKIEESLVAEKTRCSKIEESLSAEKSRTNDIVAQANEARRLLEKEKGTSETLKSENDKLKADLQSVHGLSLSTMNEITQLKEQIQAKNALLESKEKSLLEVETLYSEIDALKNTNAELEQSLKDSNLQMQKLQNSIDSAVESAKESVFNQKQSEIASLLSQIELLSNDNNQQEKIIFDHQESLKRLNEKHIEELKLIETKTSDELLKQRAEFEFTMEQQKAIIEEKNKTIQELQVAKSSEIELGSERRFFQEEIASKDLTIEELRKRILTMEQVQNDLNRQISDLKLVNKHEVRRSSYSEGLLEQGGLDYPISTSEILVLKGKNRFQRTMINLFQFLDYHW